MQAKEQILFIKQKSVSKDFSTLAVGAKKRGGSWLVFP